MRRALLALIVGSFLDLGVLLWMIPEQTMRALSPMGPIVLSLVAWRVLVVKGAGAAKQVLGVGGLAYVLFLGYVVAGVLTPAIIALPALLMMIGWLFNPRTLMWAAGVTILALWGMVVGAELGWVPTSVRSPPAVSAAIQSLMLVLTAYLTVYVSNRYTARVRELTVASDELRLRTDELEASKRRLQTVIEVSGTVFWEYHIQTDTLIYDASRLHVLALDAAPPPVTVRDWVARVHPDDKHRFMDIFQDTIRQVRPNLDHDYRIKGASNEWVWVTTRGAVIHRHGNEVPTVLGGVAVNIDARKQIEAALKASEQTERHLAQMLRSLCDNVPDMIWAKDLNKRYIFANRAMCDQLLMGTSTNEPVGKDDMFFANRERASRPAILDWHTFGELCQDSDAATLQRGQPSQFEECGFVRGRMLVLDVRKAPFVNDRGAVLGVVGTGRDITEHKAAQDRLRLAALVLEHSSEALVITDAANNIIDVNPAFSSLTGYSRDEILGKHPSVLRSGMHDADFYRLMWESLKAEGRWQGEIWNRRKNGELYAAWLTINTLFGEDGLPYWRVALASDVTENKKKQDQLWQQANFDMLTLLPNRRMFQDRLDVELKKLRRSGTKLAVLFMDLDRFKVVNDTFGHDLGDQLLRQAARRILACVRESDTVARLGGDEFTVILTDIEGSASVERVAQSIVTTLSQPFDLEAHRAEVSVSLGIAICPDHASELAALVQQADQAMYAAKQAGRNGYRFSESVHQGAIESC